MTKADDTEFAALLLDVMNTYGKSIDGGMVGVYFDVLARFPLADVTRALYAHMADPDAGTFFPKPADVIRQLQGSNGSRALAAWDVALKAVQTVPGGPYQTVTFSDPLIVAVLDRMGGWPRFYYAEEKDLPFVQKDFCERYATYLGKTPKDIPSSLPGLCEDENRGTKHAADPRSLPAQTPYLADGPSVPVVPAPEEPKALPSSSRPKAVAGFGGLGAILPATKREYLSEDDAARSKARQKAALAALCPVEHAA